MSSTYYLYLSNLFYRNNRNLRRRDRRQAKQLINRRFQIKNHLNQINDENKADDSEETSAELQEMPDVNGAHMKEV